MPGSRRDEALALAEELLTDIELRHVGSLDIARKTSRLARLLDDGDALEWLAFETTTYPTGALDDRAEKAALRSGRLVAGAEGAQYATTPIGSLELEVEAKGDQLRSLSAAAPASGEWAGSVEAARYNERTVLRRQVQASKALLDQVVGSFHSYVASKYQELRFGSAIESAFEVVRRTVDTSIAQLVPTALPMLTAAFENATSSNPEHWASAAATCRRLLKAAADELRPPGEPVGQREMTDDKYINRLVDWIQARATSETFAEFVIADLEYLGRRLDAANQAGSKGAHASVSRHDASRFVTGTYLLLGDLLTLWDDGANPPETGGT